jgi:hypothetical protein
VGVEFGSVGKRVCLAAAVRSFDPGIACFSKGLCHGH